MWITSVRYRPMVADSTLRRGALDRLNANATSINRTHPPSCTYTVRCSSPRAALALSIVLRRYLFLLCWCRSCLLACILPCALTPPRPFDWHGAGPCDDESLFPNLASVQTVCAPKLFFCFQTAFLPPRSIRARAPLYSARSLVPRRSSTFAVRTTVSATRRRADR